MNEMEMTREKRKCRKAKSYKLDGFVSEFADDTMPTIPKESVAKSKLKKVTRRAKKSKENASESAGLIERSSSMSSGGKSKVNKANKSELSGRKFLTVKRRLTVDTSHSEADGTIPLRSPKQQHVQNEHFLKHSIKKVDEEPSYLYVDCLKGPANSPPKTNKWVSQKPKQVVLKEHNEICPAVSESFGSRKYSSDNANVIKEKMQLHNKASLTPLQRNIFTKLSHISSVPNFGDFKRGNNTLNDTVAPPAKLTSRRNTYELDDTVTDIETLIVESPMVKKKTCTLKKRSTFEVDPNNSFLLNCKNTENKKQVISHIESPTMTLCDGKRKKNSDTSGNSPKRRVSWTKVTSQIGGGDLYSVSPSMSSHNDTDASKDMWKMTDISALKTPPSGTSTPFSKPAEMFSNDTTAKIVLPGSSTKKSKVKVPNYSVIHQSAYDKMENLSEYMERKAARAKALLSGSKVKIGLKKSASKESTGTTSKKQLHFPAPRLSTPQKNVTFRKQLGLTENSPKTPTKAKSEANINTLIKIAATAESKFPPTPEKSMINKKAVKNSVKIVSFRNSVFGSPIIKHQPISNYETPTNVKSRKPYNSTPHNIKHNNNNSHLDAKVVRITSPNKKINHSSGVKPGYTRFGYKIQPADIKELKDRQVKSIITKTRGPQDSVKERRNFIKGVRSNRRFDLLMNMRKKD